MRFLRSTLGRVFLAFLLSSVVAVALIVRTEWNRMLEELHDDLVAIQSFMMQSARDRLLQQEVMFKLMGQRLLEVGGLADPAETARVMDVLLENNPAFVAYGITDARGNFVSTSANLRGQDPESLGTSRDTSRSFAEALRFDGLSVGDAYYFDELQMWILPLRYAIRNPEGEVLMVVTAGMAIDGAFNPWALGETQRHSDVQVAVMSQGDAEGQYYLLYADPFEGYGVSRQEVFGARLPPRFIATADRRMREKYGLGLKDLESEPVVVGYVNDTPGLTAAYAVYSFDARFRYYLALREPMPHAWTTMNWFAAKIISGALLLNALVFFALYRVYRLDDRHRAELTHKALHDPLTGLPNRYYLEEHAEHWRRRAGGGGTVMYLDLDNFKFINDHFGHGFGDQVLQETAARLRRKCYGSMLLVRRGGDEFIILSPSVSREQIELAAGQLLYAINEVMFIRGVKIAVTGSIGLCEGAPSDDFETMLVRADIAMYEAKRYHNTYRFYSPQMDHAGGERGIIENELKAASIEQEMHLVYQPQVDGENESILGVEALLRWRSPTLGDVGPARFVPVAEECGLINALGDFVLDSALRDIAALDLHDVDFRLSINVSVHQLVYGGFASSLLERTLAHGLRPEQVVLELTESLFIEDLNMIHALLSELRGRGFGVSLDDFGTGYSSLSVLRKLPISELKIDRSFVRDILDDKDDRSLVRSIINIGESLGISVLAEGVETRQHAETLREYGCHRFQGYLFAKPMPLEELQQFLKERHSRAPRFPVLHAG